MATRVRTARTAAPAPPQALSEGTGCVYDAVDLDARLGDMAERLEGLPLAGACEFRSELLALRRTLRAALDRFDGRVSDAIGRWQGTPGNVDLLARFDPEEAAPF